MTDQVQVEATKDCRICSGLHIFVLKAGQKASLPASVLNDALATGGVRRVVAEKAPRKTKVQEVEVNGDDHSVDAD